MVKIINDRSGNFLTRHPEERSDEGSFKLTLIEVTGYSMHPFLKPGRRLVVSKVPVEKLKTGDIVLYRSNNQLICHRLIKKLIKGGRKILYIRADNAGFQCSHVDSENFLGKAVGILKNGTVIDLTTKTQQFKNRIIVIIAPFLSFAIRMIRPWYYKLWKMR